MKNVFRRGQKILVNKNCESLKMWYQIWTYSCYGSKHEGK
ncbi:hypothetical protein SAMN04488146_105247 [Bacillus nitratireducens]|nr:hypothetical protein SAMN04488146_105247 [Bacillus nitratireducens]